MTHLITRLVSGLKTLMLVALTGLALISSPVSANNGQIWQWSQIIPPASLDSMSNGQLIMARLIEDYPRWELATPADGKASLEIERRIGRQTDGLDAHLFTMVNEGQGLPMNGARIQPGQAYMFPVRKGQPIAAATTQSQPTYQAATTYTQPAPVYTATQQTYTQPATTYTATQPTYQAATTYVQPTQTGSAATAEARQVEEQLRATIEHARRMGKFANNAAQQAHIQGNYAVKAGKFAQDAAKRACASVGGCAAF